MTREEAERKVIENVKKNIPPVTRRVLKDVSFEDMKHCIIRIFGQESFDRSVEREMEGTNNFVSAIQDFIKTSEEMENKNELYRSVDRKFEA